MASRAPSVGLKPIARGMLWAALAVLLGLYMALNSIVGLRNNSHIVSLKPLLYELSSAVVIFALVPLLALFERRFPIDAKPRLRTIALHLCAALAFCTLHVAGMFGIRKAAMALVGGTYTYGDLALAWFYELQKDLITYVVVMLILFAYRQFQVRRRGELAAAELAAELSQARLAHLTSQIEPHFLFNALNAISNRMHEDVDAADRMISDLGNLLRAAYDTDGQVLVPLKSELTWLRGYAAMMTERYRGQLHFELEVSPALDAMQVPRLLLQPPVENALRHGLASGRGTLRVTVERHGALLHYRVSDDGAGIKAGSHSAGTGLANIRRRLELLFPDAHTFELKPREGGGTSACVSFPIA